MRSLCGQIGPGDGADPRLEPKSGETRPTGRKSRQLCAQVAESLSLAMAATAGDDIVAGMTVLAVEPAPDTSRMLVTVAPPKGEDLDPGEIVARLDQAAPRLRAEVAQSITRRRAPSLAFRVSLA